MKQSFSNINTHLGLTAYHGTCRAFEEFAPFSHFGSEKAALERIEYHKKYNDEDKAFTLFRPKDFVPTRFDDGYVLNVNLDIKNPYFIADMPTNEILVDDAIVENYFEKSETFFKNIYDASPTLRKIMAFDLAVLLEKQAKALYEELQTQERFSRPWTDFIFNAPWDLSVEQRLQEIQMGALFTPYPKLNNPNMKFVKDIEHVQAQRMIRFFESKGFDGFAYVNIGEDKGHISYANFRPEQVTILNTDMHQEMLNRANQENIYVFKKRDLTAYSTLQARQKAERALVKIQEDYFNLYQPSKLDKLDKTDLFQYHYFKLTQKMFEPNER